MTEQTQGIEPLSNWLSGVAYHVGLTVPDLDEGRRFYCGLLGFEEAFTYESTGPLVDAWTGIENVTVKTAMLAVPGGIRIQMQTFDPPAPDPGVGMNAPGLTHLSFGVQDVHAEYDRLSAAGVKFRAEPVSMKFDDPHHLMNGWSIVYFDDPWGMPLELLGPTPGQSIETHERPGT